MRGGETRHASHVNILVLIVLIWKNMSNTYKMHSENITMNEFKQVVKFHY